MLWELNREPDQAPQFQKLINLPMGLMYGMAVYTTFRLPLAEYWIAQHVERLMDNAQHLGLPVSYTATEFQQALIPHFQMERPVFRLTLVADVAEYSDFYQKPAKPARLLLAMREASGEASMPVSLKSVDYVRTMPLVKHLGMADVIQLKKQARLQGFQEILLAGGGKVREASTANILFIRNGQLCGPEPERDACLPGISRQRILREAKVQGIGIEDTAPVNLSELSQMQGAFLTNATKGITPVARIDDVAFPWPESAEKIVNALAGCLN